MSTDELIELHNNLTSINYVYDSGYKCNCAVKFIYEILDCTWGKSIAVEFPKNYKNFFNSTFFSNYIKNFIKENIDLSTKTELLQTAIKGDGELKDFTEEEFYEIDEALKEIEYYSLLTLLSFELDSKGAIDFLNNRADKNFVIRRIITTSGLSDRPEFYSGRGAMWCDLNSDMLSLIYNKLSRLDPNKGFNMAKMTIEMETLGATEFLENLYALSYNDYDLDKVKLSNDNVSFGNARGASMFAIGLASMASSFSSTRMDATDSIKDGFIDMLPKEVVNKMGLECAYYPQFDNHWEYQRSYRRKR